MPRGREMMESGNHTLDSDVVREYPDYSESITSFSLKLDSDLRLISIYPGNVFLLMAAALVGTVFYVLLVTWVICCTCGKHGSVPHR